VCVTDALTTEVLVLATVSTGMTAGVFAIYSNAIMPGLRATDDRTFVGAFQAIDRAIINPVWLGGGFFGALLLTGASAALHLDAAGRPVLPWLVAASAALCIALLAHGQHVL